MRQQQHADDRPGPMPEVHLTPTGIVFEFANEPGTRLVIRCDENGNVYASITGLQD